MKGIRIFLTMLLVLSLSPLGLADNHEMNNTVEDTAASGDADSTRVEARSNRVETRQAVVATRQENVQDRRETRTAVRENRRELQTNVREARQQRRDTALERRTEARERIQEARSNRELALERVENARERFAQREQLIRGARARLAQCRDADTDDCIRVRETIREEGPALVAAAADKAIEQLNALAARIEASDMDEERKAEMLERIDERIANLEQRLVEAEAVKEAVDVEEVEELAGSVQSEIRETQSTLKRERAWGAYRKLMQAADRLERIDERFVAALERANEAGLDTSGAQTEYESFSAALTSGQTSLEAAKAAYDEARSAEDSSEYVDTIVQNLRDAHEHMQEARESARAFVQAMQEVQA